MILLCSSQLMVSLSPPYFDKLLLTDLLTLGAGIPAMPAASTVQEDEYSLLQVEPTGYDPNNSDYSHLNLCNDRSSSPPPPTPPVRHSSKQNSIPSRLLGSTR